MSQPIENLQSTTISQVECIQTLFTVNIPTIQPPDIPPMATMSQLKENLQFTLSAAGDSTTLGKPEESSNQICIIPKTESSQALCSIGKPSTTIPPAENSQALYSIGKPSTTIPPAENSQALCSIGKPSTTIPPAENSQALCSIGKPSTTIPPAENSQALCSIGKPSTTIPPAENSQALCSIGKPSTPQSESSQELVKNLSLTKLPSVIGNTKIPLASSTHSENSHLHDTINLLLSTIPQLDFKPIATMSKNLCSTQSITSPHTKGPHSFHKRNIPLIKPPVESLQPHGTIPFTTIPQAIKPLAFCEVDVRGIPTPIFLSEPYPRVLHQLDNEEKPLIFPTHDQADNGNKYLPRLFPKEIPHALGTNSDTLPFPSMYSTVFSPVLDRADNGGNHLHQIFTSGNQNVHGNGQIHIPAIFPLDIPQVNSTKNVYKCDVCDKTFKHSDKLQNHLINHDKEQSYKCGVCGKTFNHKNDLQKHMRIHSGEKPYKCGVCGKSFSQNGYLKTHIKIHTGERSFKCEFCGKAFIVNSDLQKHKIIHSGEKPHVCDVCGKGYNQKSYLQTHIRIHTGERPFECGVCGSAFADSSSLHKHMNIHSRQKSYKCDVCGKTFNQNGNRRLHLRRIHGIVETKPSI